MKTLSAFSLLFVVLLINACGAQGGRNLGGGGRYCPEDQQELLEDVSEESLVYEKGTEGIAKLPTGEYEFETAEYFYVKKLEESNSRRWLMFQVNEFITTKGDKETSRYCVRGVNKGDPSVAAEVPGINSMTVGAGNKVDYEPRMWGFSYNSEKLILEAPFCPEDNPDCSGTEKTSFANKIEKGSFKDHKEVFDSFATDVKVIQYPKDEKRNVERFAIIAKTDYVEDDVPVTQLLKITYTLKRDNQIFPRERNNEGPF